MKLAAGDEHLVAGGFCFSAGVPTEREYRIAGVSAALSAIPHRGRLARIEREVRIPDRGRLARTEREVRITDRKRLARIEHEYRIASVSRGESANGGLMASLPLNTLEPAEQAWSVEPGGVSPR